MLYKVFKKILSFLLSWKRPFYSRYFYEFSKTYLDLWYGDNNLDRKINGEYRVLTKIIPKSSVIFDVGANVGSYSSDVLEINKNVIVHAFEPDPRAFEKLKLVHGGIISNNIGLGERVESKIFHQNPRSTHNSFYAEEEGAQQIKINVSTLDKYCADNSISHIDFLKIDVEGHELFVLKGAVGLLNKKAIDYIQFEFSGAMVEARTFLLDFIRLFDGYGYDLYRIRAKDIKKVEYFPDRERFTLTNYLAIRRGAQIIS